jgi:NitT/TauT family transport system substrate-binding protein
MSATVLAAALVGVFSLVLGVGCQRAETGAAAPAKPAAPPAAQPAAPASAPSAPAAPVSITVHNFGNTVNTAIIRLGIDQGYYRDEGLDVTLQNADASIGVQLIATGQVQFSTSVGSALAGAVRGIPVKVVFASADRPLWWMYAAPSITSVQELRGKRLGVSSAGSSLTIVAKLILERYGIGPDDAALLNVGTAQRLPALESGAIDAAFLVAPLNLQAAKAGFRQLFASTDEGIFLTTEGLAAGDDYLREQPDVVRRMMRASVRSLQKMRDDRAAAIDTVARFTEVDHEMAQQIYDFARVTWTTNGTADSATLRQSIDIMKLVAEVDTPVPESQAYDLSATRAVAAELGVQ